MKNDRIVNAWNQANPTQHQREKMRTALELRMELQEPERKSEESRHYDVQRIPSTRRTSSWVPIAAVVALVLAGALMLAWLIPAREVPDLSVVSPTGETTAPAEDSREAAFQPMIDKYITAITENWDGGRCAQEDISILTQDVKSLDDLGYALLDMNGDGQKELLITDGNVIYDMYVLIQGEVHHMFTGMERNAWFLCGKNTLLNIASSSAYETAYRRMSYIDETELWAQYVIHSDGTTEGQVPWEIPEGSLSKEMTDYILKKNSSIYIRHIPFSGNVVESEIPEDETLLHLYAAQIPKALENYSKDQPVTFCFYDYNGDGKRELILGAGKTYYAALHTKESTGEIGISKPFSGENSDRYFCEDGVLKIITYGDYLNISFSRKTDGPYFVTFLNLMYEEENETWIRTEQGEAGSEDREITPEEVQEILKSYPHLNLDWQPIQDFPVKVPLFPIEMFDQAFAPVASGVVDNTWNQLDPLLYYAGVKNWGSMGNQIEVANPADHSSELIAVLSGEEGKERIEQLLFTIVISDTPRTVSVEFTPEGKVYRAFVNPDSKGVKVGSVEELRAFLIQEEKPMALWRLAEEFAYAWFIQDKEAMDKVAKNGAIREYMDGEAMGPETEIEKMTIVFPSGNYSTSSGADVSIAFYEPGVTDSYTYLNLRMYQSGEWFVEQFYLEK